ncbi:MAG: tripartite tricarboxylate transporter substrate binding protein [Betaproteobacteria bacterium]|nr:tripartite tricarboxylate transporter substrate binding protein [Betaproteobacteria bacterium]
MKSLPVLLCALVSVASVQAQSYPKGPINLVIPYAPGDATDHAARPMADELSRLLKVPVLVINRAGAGGALGVESAAKASKDGYTILITNNGTLVFRRILDPATAPFDPERDFVPLGLTTRMPTVLALRANLPYKSFAELVQFAKANPGRVRFGTAGAGTLGDFTVVQVNALTGAGITPVPFKGASPALTDLLGGHIEGVAVALGVVSSHVKSGALKAIAISSRFPEFADVPTLAELGHGQNLYGFWLGFFAPAGVPAEVVNVLVPAIESVARNPGVAARLLPRGLVQEYGSPETLAKELREDYRAIQAVAKKAGFVK